MNDNPDRVVSAPPLSMEALAELESTHRNPKGVAIAAGTAVAAAAGLYVSIKYGTTVDTAQIVPNVPVVSQISEGINRTSDALTTISLPVIAGAFTAEAGIAIASRHDRTLRAISDAAKVDLSGSEVGATHARKHRFRIGKAVAGTGLAAVVLVTAAAGINREVSDGPSRAIDKTLSMVSPKNRNPYIVVQDETQQFMNNSYVSRQKSNRLVELAAQQGVTATPFSRELGDIRDGNNITNMTLGVPKPLFDGILRQNGVPEGSTDHNCSSIPVLIDGDTRINRGQDISVQNQNVEVLATVSGASSMNRMAVVEDEADVARCIQHNENADYYGVVIDAPKDQAEQLYREAGFGDEAHLVDADQFRKYNKVFWQSNGTPILLQMMMYIGGFAFIANRNERRASMQSNIKEISTLSAGGVTNKLFTQVESLRALRETAMVALPAAILAPAFAAGINAAEWGIKVGIGAREVAVGLTVTLAAKLFGARRAVKKMAGDVSKEAARG